MPKISFPSKQLGQLIANTIEFSIERRFQFLMPESLLLCLLKDDRLVDIFRSNLIDPGLVSNELESYLAQMETVPASHGEELAPAASSMFNNLFTDAEAIAQELGDKSILNFHYLVAIAKADGIPANHALTASISKNILHKIIEEYAAVCRSSSDSKGMGGATIIRRVVSSSHDADGHDFSANPLSNPEDEACVRIDENKEITEAPFVGRKDEIRKAAMALCRVRHNNIVFVGDSGVGKSSMLAGLIQYMKHLRKRSRLGRARVYRINVPLLAGNMQFAGDVEPRIRSIVGEIKPGELILLYADNLAELGPQGNNDATPDLLKALTGLATDSPFRIISTATFDLYKRIASHNPNVDASFTRIDIAEPALDPDGRLMVEAAASKVLNGHGITCKPSVMRQVVDVAHNSLSHDVAMPGRAVNLIDSIGALIEMENSALGKQVLPSEITDASLKSALKMLGYDSIVNKAEQDGKLLSLEDHLLAKIYGQSEAVHGVAESVLLAKAGLSDDTKPLAAYLFVGPTGVGKTELAKVLASELGVKLVRFDMSEYSEPHSVAKLVGSPAGYVGYDDGGLLTDAVRKDPNCVLLFDEIEKAHSAVFNLLLQVLDYAQLADNKGQKANFNGCVIIMTSNAGARFATGVGLGFGAKNEKSEVMQTELKRVFAPEFLNRLTQVVAFHDMDRTMAEMIFDRKVTELAEMVRNRKGVEISLAPDVREKLIDAGFSKTYGAREMDRAIGRELKPALMRALLFGNVVTGDVLAVRIAEDGTLVAEKSED